MPVSLNHHADDRYLEVVLKGKLNERDYKQLGPQIEDLIRTHGKLRLLVELRDFEGWTFGGLWEDIKFDSRHFSDVDRLAIVGQKRWHEAMTAFCKPFTTASIRYFEVFEIDDARRWVTLEPTEAVESTSSTRQAG